MTKKYRYFVIIFAFVFSVLNGYSQNIKTEQQSLELILKILESRYQIRFSYADINISEKRLELPNPALSLIEVLDYLETQTELEFTPLNKRFITISPAINTPDKLQILDEVFLSDYLTSGISKTPTGTIRLKPESFGILPGLIEPDVLQTVLALPGVTSIDETISNLNIRGGTNDQNLVLWDGIKMYQSGHFFGLISAFSPYLTKTVYVSKNGTSAVYGDGVSSTIDMRFGDVLNSKYTSGFGLNFIHMDGFVKAPLGKKMELQVSGRRSVTDRLETTTYNQYSDRIFQNTDLTNTSSLVSNDVFYFYDMSIKVLYDISEADKLRINFTTIYNNLDYLEDVQSTDIRDALSNGLTQRNLASGLTYKKQWHPGLLSELQVSISNYELDAINFDSLNNQRLIQENEVLDTGLKFHTQYLFSPQLSWKNGYQFSEVGISNIEDVNQPFFRRKIKRVLRSHAAYSEFTYNSKAGNSILKAGFRLNYFRAFDEILLEPRLSFNQRFTDYFKLEILAEAKSQTTSQIIDRQNDFLGVEKRRWVVANATTIPVIKSKQVSLGLHFNRNKLLISAEGYLKKVDGITTRSQGFQNQYQFVNAIGRYKVQGIDLIINKQFPSLSTWLSYSLAKNDYDFNTLNNGNSFPNTVDIRHSATFASTYTYKALKFALGLNWHSGSPFTSPKAEQPIFDNAINYGLPNAQQLPSYFRTDFSSTYNFNLDKKIKAKVGLSIWNVFDSKNTINTYYTLDDSGSISENETRSLGLTPNLSFRLHF